MLKEYIPWFEYEKCGEDIELFSVIKEKIANDLPYFSKFVLYIAPQNRFRLIGRYPQVYGFEDACNKLQSVIPEISVKDFGLLCSFMWNVPLHRFVDIEYPKILKDG